jgi:hypothetical protein
MKLLRGRPSWIALAIVAIAFTSTFVALGRPRNSPKPEDVTLVGLVVDLQTYMTEKCANDDFVKCTRDNIRGGVPVALETEDGLVIVGMGDKGPARLLVPLAYQNAEVSGKLYDRDGVLYLDMSAAKVYKEESEEEEVHPEDPHQAPPEGGTPPPEP